MTVSIPRMVLLFIWLHLVGRSGPQMTSDCLSTAPPLPKLPHFVAALEKHNFFPGTGSSEACELTSEFSTIMADVFYGRLNKSPMKAGVDVGREEGQVLSLSYGMVCMASREGIDGMCLLRVSPLKHLDPSFLYQGMVGVAEMNTIIGLSLGH